MFLTGDRVLILKGKDFDGNDLTGRAATVTNPLLPLSKDAVIEVDSMSHQIFYPKEWMKVVARTSHQ